jgi:hypothetical protein
LGPYLWMFLHVIVSANESKLEFHGRRHSFPSGHDIVTRRSAKPAAGRVMRPVTALITPQFIGS